MKRMLGWLGMVETSISRRALAAIMKVAAAGVDDDRPGRIGEDNPIGEFNQVGEERAPESLVDDLQPWKVLLDVDPSLEGGTAYEQDGVGRRRIDHVLSFEGLDVFLLSVFGHGEREVWK